MWISYYYYNASCYLEDNPFLNIRSGPLLGLFQTTLAPLAAGNVFFAMLKISVRCIAPSIPLLQASNSVSS